MQIFTITKGATSVIMPISVFDSSSTTGAKLAGLVFNTASLTAYYNRSGAAGAAVAITLATATKGTWATGGFVAIDGTNMPGDYELHIPDAALATGANTVLVQLKGAANMVPKNIQINLTSADLQNATTLGLTNLDAAVSTRMATYTQPAGFLAATFPTGTVANTTNITAATGIVLSGVTHTGAVIPTVSAVTGLTAATVHSDLDDIQARLPAALVAGRIDASVGAVAANAITAAAIADGAIDRATFAADTGLQNIRANTAQAGAATTITLDAGASAVTDFYVGSWIYLTGAVGVGQVRVCTAYNGTTKVATIAPAWATNPDVTSTFAVIAAGHITGVQGNVTGSVGSVTGAVGSVTGLTASNLDTTVSSRMATYTQPAGFLAATFPAGTVANTTNITGGTITTTTNLTTNNDKTGYSLTVAEEAAIADAYLGRNVAGGSNTGRLVKEALYVLRNKTAIAAGTLTVYGTDDTTAAFTAAVTTAAGNPIDSIDPV